MNFYYMCIGGLPAGMCMWECQILGLQTVVSCHVGVGIWTQALWKKSVFLTAEPSLLRIVYFYNQLLKRQLKYHLGLLIALSVGTW